MKFRITSQLIPLLVVIIIVLSGVIWLINRAISDYTIGIGARTALVIFFLLVAAAMTIPILVGWKDLNAIVQIDSNGVQASTFGKIWFNANWSELIDIGEFEHAVYINSTISIYFSKVPVNLKADYFKRHSSKMIYGRENMLFLKVSPELRTEVLRHIGEERIKKCGGYYNNGEKWKDYTPR